MANMIKKNFYITEIQNKDLKEVSEKTGETESSILRESLRNYLKSEKKELKNEQKNR